MTIDAAPGLRQMLPVRHDGATLLRIGIAGLGRLGRRHAANLALRVPGARLAVACSLDPGECDWARRELGVERVDAEFDALLADPGLDALFLVTPTALHADQIIAALRAGKHVFCEKPLSLDLADCRRVEDEAARHPHLKVMIGFVRRFDPSYQAAQAAIARGDIGRPFMVRSQTCDRNDPSGFFVRFAASSGGLFLDCSVHDIDLARWLLGAPRLRRAYATGTIALHAGLAAVGDVDNGLAICEFDGGQLACFHASRTLAHGHETTTEISGTSGRLSVGVNPRLNRVEIADHLGVRNECTPTFYERFEEAFLREAQEFVAAVRDDRAPALTLHDATEATRIGLALAHSQRTGTIWQSDGDPL